jgi:prepilin-type N-terminal cleavage/methylation domain-containing protein
MAKRAGFTLIELLVVVSIIALLVSIMMPALNQARAQAQNAVCKVGLHSIGVGIETYKSEIEASSRQPMLEFASMGIETYESALDLTTDGLWQWGGGTADNCHEWHDAGVHQSLVDDYDILPDREVFFCPSVANLSYDHNYVYSNTTPMNEYQMLQATPNCSYGLNHPFHVAWLEKMASKGITNHFYFWSSYIWLWTKVDYDHDVLPRKSYNGIARVNHASDDVLMGEMSPSVYGIVEYDWPWTRQLNIKPPINHYNALFKDGHVEQPAGTNIEYNMWLWDTPYWAGSPTINPYEIGVEGY